MGGPADAGVYIAQLLIGIEPIMTFIPPRNYVVGCIYCDDDHPHGFSLPEKTPVTTRTHTKKYSILVIRGFHMRTRDIAPVATQSERCCTLEISMVFIVRVTKPTFGMKPVYFGGWFRKMPALGRSPSAA